MNCPYYRAADSFCKVGSVEVNHIACASPKLCNGRRYEACPLYFASFFIGREAVCNAAT